MNGIELSNKADKTEQYEQTANYLRVPSTTRDINIDFEDGADEAATINVNRQSTGSTIPNAADLSEPKKSFWKRLVAKIPPYPLLRTTIKASTAILIAMIIVCVTKSASAMGSASVLVPISTYLSFPMRPIGVQIEASIQGLLGALVGSAWSILGTYLANLAREPGAANPVQPKSSAILAIFMLIGVFGLTYVRTKYVQASFATIFASMIVAFSLTQASITPLFTPAIVYAFLIPIATGTAIGLAVDVLLWPDDSITKFMGVLNKSLTEYNNFFEEHSNAFLSQNGSSSTSLPTLHARLQSSILSLIDCKREVRREILFNRLSQIDVRNITKLVKVIRTPLHGIGLSLITKTERLEELHISSFSATVGTDHVQHKKEFLDALEELRKLSQNMSDVCVLALGECNERLTKYSGKPRSLKSTILWPFPRIFLSEYRKQETDTTPSFRSQKLSDSLDEAIERYQAEVKQSTIIFIEPGSKEFGLRFKSLLQIIYLYQFNLTEHAKNLRELALCVEEIEEKRTKRKLWMPKLTIQKYFESSGVDGNFGGQAGVVGNGNTMATETATSTFPSSALMLGGDLTLTQTRTRPDVFDNSENLRLEGFRDRTGTLYKRDPDVNPPNTRMERFFYGVNKVFKWFQSSESVFALKTAGGFVLLSLPAYLSQSAAWFFAWRGQWATITLMMWMFPTTGMFLFTVALRLVGTITGGVLGIICYEIVRGNPWGLPIIIFVVSCPLYYYFFTSPILKFAIIMTHITLLMVVSYEHSYVLSGATNYDSVELVAGKRMLLVCIGVGASAILSLIPRPTTGRVELRKRISSTINDISKLYSIMAADVIQTWKTDTEPTEGQKKAFRKLTLGVRRQIEDERSFLKSSKLEPTFSGSFPLETYTVLVEKLDNMADLLQDMAFASRSVNRNWRHILVVSIQDERLNYLASILSIMKILSATLASKMALPPFILSPLELRENLTEKLGEAIKNSPEIANHKSFPSYCAYITSSYKFSGELSEVLECVEKLVGVEDPLQWLLLHA